MTANPPTVAPAVSTELASNPATNDVYVLPASFAQQRLWFLNQLEPHSPFYSIPNALRLEGALDVTALQEALNALLERHESLRTTFTQENGEPFQVVHPFRPFALEYVNLSELSDMERERALSRVLDEQAQLIFDLEQFPLSRMVLVRVTPRVHILTLTIHHIVFDGWSRVVFLNELRVLYEAFIANAASPLPELPIQYADYAIWQREHLQGAVLERELDYWRRQLADAPLLLELPTNSPRLSMQTYRGRQMPFRISARLVAALEQLARAHGATLNMTLLAAFQILLYRYTAQNDILVGTPIANRNRQELAGLIGFLVNTLVIRTPLSDAESFRALLARVRDITLEAYSHQELPFEKLVEVLQPARSLSYSPVFQVAFNFINLAEDDSRFGPLEAEWLPDNEDTSKFDLSLTLQPARGELVGHFEYSTDLFEATTIERMIAHWQTQLASIVANPDAPIASLAILPNAERAQLLNGWNATASDSSFETLPQLFQVQVEYTPNAIALVHQSTRVTFRELNVRANQLAHALQKRGVGVEARVAVMLERSPELIAALLAILKAGGAYVPLDPAYPRERLRFMLDDAQPQIVIAETKYLDALAETNAQVICLDREREVLERESVENLKSRVTPENAAYVLYTSGSTGQPKGVVGLHRGAVNRLEWMWRAYPFARDEVCCQKTSLNFVDAVWEIFGPLLQGVTSVIVPDAIVQDPRAFLQLLAAARVTRLVAVPSLWQALSGFRDELRALTHLNYLISSGEPLRSELAHALLEAIPTAMLLNLYGMTECAGDSTYSEMRAGEWFHRVLIGRPIANTQIYLLDANLQPVPIGVRGEIFIGGAGLARGYLNRPELTSEKFIPNPFVRDDDTTNRLYRTGDQARYLADGNLEYLGRGDQQITLRGMRVELGEVENVLRTHPHLAQAVVTIAGETNETQRLIAYVVPQTHADIDASALYEFMKTRLPGQMIPAAFVTLEKFPLTPTGKIDRRALPLPGREHARVEHEFNAPRTPLEKQLAEIWQRVLQVDSVGVNDDFFELGGHSLLAIRLFYEMERALGQRLPLTLLFQAPTISALARQIGHSKEMEHWSPLVPIQAHGNQTPFFCVHGFGGGVVGYALLARLLGAEQPFYGLQARGQDGKQEPDRTIESMAANYLAALRTIQPRGPYALGGYCYGGTVALEMAQQLMAQGETVQFLGMFENPAPKSNYRRMELSRAFLKRFLANVPPWFNDFMELDARHKWIRFRREAANFFFHQELLTSNFGRKLRGVDLRDVIDDVAPIPMQRRNLMEQHVLAILDYFPKRYAGHVTVFRTARQPLLSSHDPMMGWGMLAASVEVRHIAGSHHNILEEPYVHSLAQELQASLREAHNGSNGTGS